MPNSLTTNPIVLEDFTSAIDLTSAYPDIPKKGLRLQSIEWTGGNPATPDTATILGGASGNIIFYETAVAANQPAIKYFHGQKVKNLYIAAGGVTAGKLIITLARQ